MRKGSKLKGREEKRRKEKKREEMGSERKGRKGLRRKDNHWSSGSSWSRAARIVVKVYHTTSQKIRLNKLIRKVKTFPIN